MIHIYTFGKKSKQFLILTPKQAESINDFNDRFSLSQQLFMAEHGRPWHYTEPLAMVVADDNKNLPDYNSVAGFANKQHAIRNKIFDLFRIDVSTEDIDDHLVKRI